MEIKIIRRRTWKAKNPRVSLLRHVPNKITIHHQGGENDYPNIHQIPCFDGYSTIRAIQRRDIYGDGLMDIRYHFIIGPRGQIYEGREINLAGAHTKNNHNGNIGIMLIGNFNIEHPTDLQLQSLSMLLSWIYEKYPHLDFPACVYPHRALNHTDCPGSNLLQTIFEIKAGLIALEE